MNDLRASTVADQLTLRQRIESAWGIDTTFCPDDYAGQDPAYGQCGVTSVYLHIDYGALLWGGTVGDRGHYWATLNGVVLDYTWRQFPAGSSIVGARPVQLYEIASDEWLQARCHAFIERVRAAP